MRNYIVSVNSDTASVGVGNKMSRFGRRQKVHEVIAVSIRGNCAMSLHWTLRWFVMLALFAISTFAFSAYAGATSSPDGEASTLADVDDDRLSEGASTTSDDSRVASEDREQSSVTVIERSPEYMLTITRSALLGALLGALVGGSFYVLTRPHFSAWSIAYSSAAGVLFGATVGVIEIAVREPQPPQDRRVHRPTVFDDTPGERAGSSVPAGLPFPILRWTF